tara:strand:+ start:3711 stop:4442 length:732 start_codon:yes stop_codon:yes gene_type:complete
MKVLNEEWADNDEPMHTPLEEGWGVIPPEPLPSVVMSPSIVNVASALCAAQQHITPVFAEAKADFYNSMYADFTAVREGIREHFGAAGLALVQCPTFNAATGYVEVTTMIIHGESGEYIQSTLAVKPEKPGPQAIGSATTYAKRYSLASMVGVVPTNNRLASGAKEDDDGESATTDPRKNPSGMKKPGAKKTRQSSKKKGAVTKQQRESKDNVSTSPNEPEKASESVDDEKQPEPPLGGIDGW